MLTLKKETAARICAVLGEKFPGFNLSEQSVAGFLEYPPDRAMGDLAFPCFRLCKTLRRSAADIAAVLSEALRADEEYASVESAGGFVNFRVNTGRFAARVWEEVSQRGERYGSPEDGNGRVVVLDYSSPNVAKPFHIGHLGTTVIGHSLKLLHEFAGYRCVGINYLGDWGTQFGKLIVAYKKWGERARVEEEGVDALVALYVRINNEIQAQQESDTTGQKRSALGDEARAEFAKLEHGDEENLALWRWFVSVSLNEYEKTYKQLGITFDSYKGESFYTDKMPAQVEKLREMGLLKVDDGASIVDLSAYDMPACLILKRDGSTLYPTRDIAAAVYRYDTYHFDKAIYVTSAAQSLHFAQWFKVVELMGYPWYDRLVHVPYGTVSINGTKLATRTGNVILLKDLFAEAISRVRDITKEKHPDPEECDAIAEKVGVGAIVFYYLSNNRMRDINFMMEDALSFDGNTGPYAQYTYARTCSVLEKARGDERLRDAPLGEREAQLVKTIARFPEIVKAAIDAYEPSLLTRYILDLCAAYNGFYHDCPILSCEDEKLRESRVALTAAASRVLKTALRLICMQTPEKI